MGEYPHRKRAPVQIDRNIPLPPKGRIHTKYPWYDMRIGDSFACSVPNPKPPARLTDNGWRFKSRTAVDYTPSQPHYRIWRSE